MKKKKHNRGGARPGSGVKPQFNEPTERLRMTVPASQIEKLKELIRQYLNEYKNKAQ